MEEQKKSIWGNGWASIRKWFYPAWLAYEISIRFYDYSQSVHLYFEAQQNSVSFLGKFGIQAIDAVCSTLTFVGCSVFLTAPACFLLYHFFKQENLTDTRFEEKMKIIF